MVAVVAFAVAGLLWLWLLVSTVRARDERPAIRAATYVGLGLLVPVVAIAYIAFAR